MIRSRRLPVLWLLYFAQGLPYGFQATALPVLLREAGVSLETIGFASVLSLPWMLKVFWSPVLDRGTRGRWGRRKSWIVPLQALLVLATAAGVFLAPTADDPSVRPIVALVVLLNLLAATLDIAVDGLAVDLLEPHELGLGNIAQVVGFKFGMLTGGGFLVWASESIGWTGLFGAMAGLLFGTLALTAAWKEPPDLGSVRPAESVGKVFGLLKEQLRRPGTIVLLGFILTYKLGETMADAMFKPFLVDAGITAGQIGLWIGTWGMVFSIGGSIVGGWAASRWTPLRAVLFAAMLRVGPVAAQWWLAVAGVDRERVIAVACAENFFGGALTTAMFAFMMSCVDRRIGATHYTLLASTEVWGKLPASWLGGLVAGRWGFPTVFAVATALSIVYLAWFPVLRRPGEIPPPPPTPGAPDDHSR